MWSNTLNMEPNRPAMAPNTPPTTPKTVPKISPRIPKMKGSMKMQQRISSTIVNALDMVELRYLYYFYDTYN